jgi:hypothetical protein
MIYAWNQPFKIFDAEARCKNYLPTGKNLPTPKAATPQVYIERITK